MSIHPREDKRKAALLKLASDTSSSLSDVRIEYTNNYGKYLAYARLLTPSIMNAEDLVQQAFINTVAHIKKGNDVQVETLGAYLMSSIRNISISTHRKDSHQPKLYVVEEHQTSPDVQHQLSAEKQVVVKAIGTLSEAQRTITVMYYFESLKVHEIAAELSLSESAVKTHLQRARKHLAQRIESDSTFSKDA